jgi:hypothetical protein
MQGNRKKTLSPPCTPHTPPLPARAAPPTRLASSSNQARRGKQQLPSVAGEGVECGMGRRRAFLGQRSAAERHLGRHLAPPVLLRLPSDRCYRCHVGSISLRFRPQEISCAPTDPFLFPCSSSCCTEPTHVQRRRQDTAGLRRSQISLLVYIVATPFAASSKCCYTASLFPYLDLHVA